VTITSRSQTYRNKPAGFFLLRASLLLFFFSSFLDQHYMFLKIYVQILIFYTFLCRFCMLNPACITLHMILFLYRRIRPGRFLFKRSSPPGKTLSGSEKWCKIRVLHQPLLPRRILNGHAVGV
jgi:hypothetical protein